MNMEKIKKKKTKRKMEFQHLIGGLLINKVYRNIFIKNKIEIIQYGKKLLIDHE